MKGIIFNLLEEVVTEHIDEETWELALGMANVDGVYTSLGNYDDAELFALLDALGERTKLSRPELLRWFGRHAIAFLAERYPEFFTPHQGLKGFLFTLDDVIHSEVRKLYPGARVPEFEFEDLDDSSLVVRYRSQRKLCHLAEGFIEGAAGHYGQRVSIQQLSCMLEGGEECAIVCEMTAGIDQTSRR